MSKILKIFHLTPLQEGFLFHSLYNPDEITYYLQNALFLEGPIDIEILKKSWQMVIDRHESLRTDFRWKEAKVPVQLILKEKSAEIYESDISSQTRSDQETYLEKLKQDILHQPFDFERGKLNRLFLVKMAEKKYFFCWSFHHIILDGWSAAIVIDELLTIYYGLVKQGPLLPPPPAQFSDYLEWLKKQDREQGMKFWQDYMTDFQERTLVPMDKPSQRNVFIKNVGKYNLGLDKEMTGNVLRFCQERQVTANTLILTVWGILLQKYNQQETACLGTTVNGRPFELDNVEHIVGLFINTIPVLVKTRENHTLAQLLRETGDELVTMQQYEYMALAKIKKMVELDSTEEIFDSLVVFQNFPDAFSRRDDLDFNIIEDSFYDLTNFDLTIEITQHEVLDFILTYNTDLFFPGTITRIFGHLVTVLQAFLDRPGELVKNVSLLSSKEQEEILETFNGTMVPLPAGETVEQWISREAGFNPAREAVQCAGKSLTFGQLEDRANNLATLLAEKTGGNPGFIAGLLLERSLEMMVAILGVWKAGGAYLPLDKEYPLDRLRYIIKDSNMLFLLTAEGIMSSVEISANLEFEPAVIYVERIATESVSTSVSLPGSKVENPAYIIYTSGSTGKPKGAVVEHQGMMNHMLAKIHDLGINGESIIAQNASHCFDISVWQFFAALMRGGKTVIYREAVIMNPPDFLSSLIRDKITILEVVPSYLGILLDTASTTDQDFNHIKYLLVTGEEVSKDLVTRWFSIFPRITMVNAYGPTEASDDITHCFLKEVPQGSRIPVGKPLQNFKIYIVDEQMNLCPVGVKGEIGVAGPGVGRGYLNDIEKTARVFIPNPFMGGEYSRLYKTGDLGRWLPGGDIEFYGRKDYQLKIRGFRIEPGEIEACLLGIALVKDAAVVVRESNLNPDEKRLVAFIVPARALEVNDMEQARLELQEKIPGYMIPALWIPLEKMPLTRNGKIDRRALLDIARDWEKVHHIHHVDYGPAQDGRKEPRGEVEQVLLAAFAEVLKLEQVSVDDNFFHLGGDSIMAMMIISRLLKYQYKLDIRDLVEHSTVKELVPLVKKIHRQPFQGIITGDIRPTPIQHSFFSRHYHQEHHFNMAVMIFREEGFNAGWIKTVFDRLVAHHDALRMVVKKQGDRVVLYNRADDDPGLYDFQVRDLTGFTDPAPLVEEAANSLQQSLDLYTGPLVKLGLFHTTSGDHLLIIIHHLVMDGVSWRILLEDFSTAYQQVMNQAAIRLPEKTDSFKHWSETLHVYAQSRRFLDELEQWKKVCWTRTHPLPGREKEENISFLEKDAMTLSLDLPGPETSRLLACASVNGHPPVETILLTALALAIYQWTGLENIRVNLESHGRDESIGDLFLMRTLGWFTSEYPVILNVSPDGDLEKTMNHVREALAAVPHNGIGYGLMQYLADIPLNLRSLFNQEAGISFNYIGQIDERVGGKEALFHISKLPTGQVSSLENQMETSLEITGMILDLHLTLTFHFNRLEFPGAWLEKLVEFYRDALQRVIHYLSLLAGPAIEREGGKTRPVTHIPGNITNIITLSRVDEGKDRKVKNIFCIHPSGGSGLCYRDLAGVIHGYNFYAIRARGLEGNEIPFQRLEDMLGEYIRQILAVQPQGPFILTGYSFGGCIAYELANALEQQGMEIEKVIIIDNAPFNPELDFQPESELKKDLVEILERNSEKLLHADELTIDGLLELLSKKELHPDTGQQLTMEDLGRLKMIYLGNAAIALEFNRKKREHLLKSDIYYIRSRDEQAEVPPGLSWQNYTTGKVWVIEIPGNHFNIIAPPFVQGLGEAVSRILEPGPGINK